MGAWNTDIKANDVTLDVYTSFFDKYNNGGAQSWASKKTKTEYADYFSDSDDKHNALFGLALAQWETKSLESEIYQEVKTIIENNADLDLWKSLGADEKTIVKRQKELQTFLKLLSSEKTKAKRRVKPKYKFEAKILFNLEAPDGNKTCIVQKNYINDKYQHTSCTLKWEDSGSGVFQFANEKAELEVSFINNKTIEVIYNQPIVFQQKKESFFYNGDEGVIVYKQK